MRNSFLFKPTFFNFLILYFASVIAVYFLPPLVSKAFFFSLLILFWKSQDDYFWIALIFFMVDAPGYLFPVTDPRFGLPHYGLFPGGLRDLFFQELFIFVAYFKSLKRGINLKFYYLTPLLLLAIYMVGLYIFSINMGMAGIKHLRTIRMILPWSFLFSLLTLMNTYDKWLRFFSLIYPLIYIIIFCQFIHILTGYPVSQYLGGSLSLTDNEFIKDNPLISDQIASDIIRPISSSYIVLTIFSSAMFFLMVPQNFFSKRYLLFIISLSFLSILLTATRGWILAFSMVLVIFMFFIIRSRVVFKFFVPITAVFLLILFTPAIRSQISFSLDRLSTLNAMVKGDLTAEGTVARVVDYTPALLNVWKESPVMGWGFTDKYYANSNPHAGFANLLMHVGLIGIALFVNFWIYLLFSPVVLGHGLNNRNRFKKAMPVLSLYFSIFLFLHFTSAQQFEFMIGYSYKGFGLLIFLAFSSFMMMIAKNEELELRGSISQ